MIIQDLSVQNELERQRAMIKFEQIMFASINHELKTPINVIINCLNCIETCKSQTEQNKWIKVALNSCKMLYSLVMDTLDFASLKLGKFTLQNQLVYLDSLVADIQQLMTVSMMYKENVKLSFVIEENVKNEIFIDRQRLSQILINLLKNSQKFTTRGEIRLTLRNEVRGRSGSMEMSEGRQNEDADIFQLNTMKELF